jgi:hypothetical protein
MSGMRKWIAPLLVGLALGPVGLGAATASTLVAASPAGAAAVDCSSGLIVAADFGTWGGAINTVCDPQLPDNAADALVATNFQPVGVASYGGLNFICTIGGYPQNDPCTTTPPGNAYWSFWYADAGANTWTYSPLGAENLHPQAGSVEGWVFGGNTGATPPASFPAPNTLRAATSDIVTTATTAPPPTTTSLPPTLTTTAATSPPPAPGHPSGTSPASGSASGSGGAAGKPGAQQTPGAKPAVGTTGTTPGTGPTDGSDAPTGSTVGPHPSQLPSTVGNQGDGGSSSAPIPKIIDAAPTVAGLEPAPSPIPFVVGAVIVVLLAGGGGFIAWRRRRTG